MKHIKRPNRFLYWLACMLTGVFFRAKYHLRIEKQDFNGIKPPFVVICNHVSNMDALLLAIAMRPFRLHFVTGAYHFRSKLKAWLLGLMGCISKEQFFMDYNAARSMIKAVQQGGNVAIFPSGQSSYSGESTWVGRGIAPLLQKMGVPVVNAHIRGAHFAFPKWNMSKMRAGAVTVQVSPLLSRDDLCSMDKQAVFARVEKALYFNDYDGQRQTGVRAKAPRNAEGLQKVLFMCPRCKAEFSMRTQGNRLWCDACGNAALMNEYGFLRPENDGCVAFETPPQWNRWQFDAYRQAVAAPGFVYCEPCSLYKVERNGKYTLAGKGEARLNAAFFQYAGTYQGESVDWKVDNAHSAVFPHEKETSFDVMVRGQLYAIAPDRPQSVFKFMLLKELMYATFFEDASLTL